MGQGNSQENKWDLMTYEEQKEHLKTHPDCKQRITATIPATGPTSTADQVAQQDHGEQGIDEVRDKEWFMMGAGVKGLKHLASIQVEFMKEAKECLKKKRTRQRKEKKEDANALETGGLS
jgi:hypothetical protein